MKVDIQKIGWLTVAAALSVGGLTWAQGPGLGEGPQRGGPDQRMRPRIQFDELDTNADGMVSYEEFLARHDRIYERLASRFAEIDEDGDGVVTLAEFLARSTRRMADRYATLDADGNGAVSREEFENRSRPTWAGARGPGGKGARGPMQDCPARP